MIDITVINDYSDTVSVNDLLIKKNLENLFQDQQVSDAKVSIILSNKFLLNQLKKNYFQVDQFTDVITFNLDEDSIFRNLRIMTFRNEISNYKSAPRTFL